MPIQPTWWLPSPGTVTASDTALWEALLQSAIEKNACEVPVTWGDFDPYVTKFLKCQEIGAFLHQKKKKKQNCKLPAFVGGLHRQFPPCFPSILWGGLLITSQHSFQLWILNELFQSLVPLVWFFMVHGGTINQFIGLKTYAHLAIGSLGKQPAKQIAPSTKWKCRPLLTLNHKPTVIKPTSPRNLALSHDTVHMFSHNESFISEHYIQYLPP